MSKYLAVVQISDPSEVATRCTTEGINNPKDGAIFVTIPELGFTNYMYCRYGLSFPYIRVKVGWKVWVEPTMHGGERWIYTGLADCGQDSDNTPTTDDQIILKMDSGKYTLTVGDTSFLIDENEITITNDTAEIVIDSSGKFSIKNEVYDFKTLIDSLIETIKALGTTGSPVAQKIDAASQVLLTAEKTKWAQLLV